jgi:spore coat polysaccharide biosynthesis protein SpsF
MSVTTPRVIVCIQARMGSTRLPAKVLRPVLDRPLLLHMVDRVRRATTVDEAVVITSTNQENDRLAALCQDNGIPCFRGSETDLLDRHYQAARHFGADLVAKIPSDCPLTDPRLVDEVLSLWIDHQDDYDYVSNYHPPTFPDGLDVEGAPMPVLATAWREAAKPLEREHTFPLIWDNPERFRIGNVSNPRGNLFMTHRWTLDYEEDYEFIRTVFEELKENPQFHMDDVLGLLERKPEIAAINQRYAGVNWYRKHQGELRTVTADQYRDAENPTVTRRL